MLKQVGFYIGSLTAIFIYNIAKVSLNSVFTFQVFTIYISSIVYRVQISYYIYLLICWIILVLYIDTFKTLKNVTQVWAPHQVDYIYL